MRQRWPQYGSVKQVFGRSADVLNSAEILNEASGLPVLAFDWASAHSLGMMPKAAGLPVPGLISGYLKDTEASNHSDRQASGSRHWLIILLFGQNKHLLPDLIVIEAK